MKRILGLLLGLTACAPAAGPAIHKPVEDVVTISSADGTMEGEVRLTREDYAMQGELPAARSVVWEELAGAFVDIDLPYPQLDAATWTAGVQNHRVTRRLGSRRLSTLFDCGRGAAGAYADSYRLYLTITAELTEATAEATSVVTRIDAKGQPTSGLAGTVTCTSRGSLEGALMEALTLRIAKRVGGD